MAKHGYLILIAFFVFSSMNCYALKISDTHSNFNISKIQQLTGKTGQFDSDEKMLTLVIPRDDLAIQMSGMHFTGDRGLSSTIVFKKSDEGASVSGDLVLLQDQVNPVLSVALANGLKVTGLNNPYLWDSPRIMLMHIQGEGDALQLANAIGKVLSKIKTTANGGGDFPVGNVYSPATTLDGHRVDILLGTKGQFKKDVYEVQFNNSTKKSDPILNKLMATNTWAAFSGSDSEAVVNGGIVIHQSELQQALLTLRKAQFYILSIYPNSYNDDPTLVSVNFWGVGPIQVLAKALRSSFLIAKNGNVSQSSAGTMLATSLNAMTNKAGDIIPISPALVQNNYCGYANALRTSSAEVEKEIVNKNPQSVVKVVVNVASKVIEKRVPVVIQVKNEKIQIKWIQRSFTVSAKRLLSKLSVVQQNKWKDVLVPRLKNSNVSPEKDHLRMLTKLRDAERRLQQAVAALHMRPVFSIVPVLKDNTQVQRLSMLSARQIISRLSVSKNKKFI